MRIKGVNLIEQHCEKLVLGASLALLVGFGIMQYLSHPNDIEVQGRPTKPAEVDEKLSRLAVTLDQQTHSTDVVSLPDVASIGELFDQRRDLSTVAALAGDRDAVPWGAMHFIDLSERGEYGPADEILYAELELEPLPQPVANAGAYSLNREQFETIPELAIMFPEEAGPADLRAVSIETTLLADSVRKALDRGEDSDDLRPIPTSWYDEQLFVGDVVVQRQQRLADGSWSEPVELDPLPGRSTVRSRIRDEQAQTSIADFIETRNDVAEHIESPLFYEVRTNQWTQPSHALLDDVAEEPVDDDSPTADVERKLERQYRERDRQITKRDGMDQRISDLEERKRDSPRPDPISKQIKGIQAQLEIVKEKIAQVEERIQELVQEAELIDPLWVDPFDESARGRSGEDPDKPELISRSGGSIASSDVETILQREEITLWAHDITVQPGGVYRYRIRYDVINPFVGKASRLNEKQRSLAEALVVKSPWSTWGEPVHVPAETYFFITAANTPQPGSPVARASAEMYEYYDGFWRKAEASLEPGDQVAKSISVSILPDEAASPRPRDVDGPLPTTRIMVHVPITLLDVVERPIKERTVLGGSGIEQRVFQAVLCDAAGQIILRAPSLEAASEDRAWLIEAVKQADASLQPEG
ncbi:MAG: hypothetical protein KAS72_13795 [Phycisphaerales bacterium]|nr:hypothetical protein [Phycisphaerales bacterium]